MTVAAEIRPEDGTVRGRLILAADAEVAEHGIAAVQMEAIARRAGVSRATAFRQLGSISEVLVQVALLRARRHVAAVDALMAKRTGTFAKLEAALIYTARELPTDPSIAALIAQHSASVHDPRVHGVAMGVISPVLEEGRRDGEVRTDLPISELVDFLVEQTYLAAEELDRSTDVVRRRFRHFVVPGLEARDSAGGEFLSRTKEVEHAVGVAIEALGDLARHLHRDRAVDTAP
ncbi:TetR/AcrR family transcriptional regulator [Mycolicibacter kumamotonensis]|uniref:TetR/AcrR family transcriptional regulator n=1 Tax=Mycolicibacter kumamotonensis TaxID=354243 RepID=A0A7K3L6K0_9MYCO|nr:TetR/AcrR family transcriptional regulator [Mycolicibacter kumamotonensis]NDJ87927.1 TetR/AcrR family transcriptional regulator [Mycolicibacter kumamotonensis]